MAACIINPWKYYIVNDEMPEFGGFDDGPEFRKAMWSLFYAVVVCILWAVGVHMFAKHVIGFGAQLFGIKYITFFFPSLGILIFLIIFGINKIFNHNKKK